MKNFFNFLAQFNKWYYFLFILLGLLNSIIEILGLSLMFPLFEILLGNGESKFISFLKDKKIIANYKSEEIFTLILISILIVYITKFFISILIVYLNNLIKQNIKIEVQKKILNNFFERDSISHGKDSIPIQIRI